MLFHIRGMDVDSRSGVDYLCYTEDVGKRNPA